MLLWTFIFFTSVILCRDCGANVLVSDSGVQRVTIGPGAPKHTIGLQGHRQVIALDTGAQIFGLRYVVALDPKDPKAAVPGEGYIGMTRPVDCNWYGGGFFDLQINGKSIGTTFVHSFTGRGSANRGTADFVFDHPLAVVRIRFVALSGGDVLFTQALLEPKEEIKALRLLTQCYPSGFITDGARHVCTAMRDFAQGERAMLDVDKEWWTLYYDQIYDAGHIGTGGITGVGPCAMLWLTGHTEKVGFTVGNYGITTVLDLKPTSRDLRFVFLDYAGKKSGGSVKNEAAIRDIKARCEMLRQELSTFVFTDPLIANWPLETKKAEIQRALASFPDTDTETAARYEKWSQELSVQLKLLHSGAAGSIMAEAEAARIIGEWERGLPELQLRALLNQI